MQQQFDLRQLNGQNGFFAEMSSISTGYHGWSVKGAGDINGDGLADLVLGAPYAGPMVNFVPSFSGAAYVVFGSRSNFSALFNLAALNGQNGFIIEGIVPYGFLGWSVGTAGDMNGDGLSDLVLGAPSKGLASTGKDQTGTSYVIFGSRNSFSAAFNLTALNGSNGFSIRGVAVNGTLGTAVSTAGDVNGDGLSDLLLGAPDQSISYVILGTRNGFPASFNLTALNGSNGFSIPGIIVNATLGSAVSTAGDINGDGVDDFALSALFPRASAGLPVTSNGLTYIIFGNRVGFPTVFNLTTLNGSNGFTILGSAPSVRFSPISTAGDMNGDGFSDFVVGNSLANSLGTPGISPSYGESYLVWGHNGSFPAILNLTALNGIDGFIIRTFPGTLSVSGRDLGISVSSAGDINKDGLSDLLVGDQSFNGPYASGQTYVILGSRSGFSSPFNLNNLNGTNGFIMVPGIVSSGAGLGQSVGMIGDMNGDGLSDMGIGMPYYINSTTSVFGIVAVVFSKFPLIWISNQMTIQQGQVLTLSPNEVNAMDIYYPQTNLIFTLANVNGGRFELISNPGTGILNFTKTQLNTAQIRFVSNRMAPVSYEISVTNGPLTLPFTPANVNFTNHSPEVVGTIGTKNLIPNQPFQFTIQADGIFTDKDNDTLTYSIKSSDNLPLPSWISFSSNPQNQLDFSGTAPLLGGARLALSAQDPLNTTATTEFDLSVQPGNGTSVNNFLGADSAQIAGGVVGGLLGLSALISAGYAFWSNRTDKRSRNTEQFADLIRSGLNLKGADNFDSEAGQKYVSVIHRLQKALQEAGIDPSTMRPLELQQLADDVADAARNKITPATNCLRQSVITVTDLNDNLEALVSEVQILRNAGRQSAYTL